MEKINLKLPKKVVHTYLVVRTKGMNGHFSQDGYSQYHKRWNMERNGEIQLNEVYGYEQALAHIDELRESVYDEKKHYENVEFEIVEKTTVTAIYKTIK